MSTLRRALVLTELGLALDSEVIATIAEVDLDAPAAWLPARVFGTPPRGVPSEMAPTPTDRRRALILVDGARVEVPETMHLVESVEVLAIPELLRTIAERGGVIGLAILPAGLALFCDPCRIAGAGHES